MVDTALGASTQGRGMGWHYTHPCEPASFFFVVGLFIFPLFWAGAEAGNLCPPPPPNYIHYRRFFFFLFFFLRRA